MIIVDTTVWIDYFRGTSTPETDWLDRSLPQHRLGLTDLILCEVLQGLRDKTTFEQVQRNLLKLEVFSTGGTAVALAAAMHYRTLREKGYTVRRTIDCLIATFCLRNDHALLHNDRDFDPFEQALGLVVIHP